MRGVRPIARGERGLGERRFEHLGQQHDAGQQRPAGEMARKGGVIDRDAQRVTRAWRRCRSAVLGRSGASACFARAAQACGRQLAGRHRAAGLARDDAARQERRFDPLAQRAEDLLARDSGATTNATSRTTSAAFIGGQPERAVAHAFDAFRW